MITTPLNSKAGKGDAAVKAGKGDWTPREEILMPLKRIINARPTITTAATSASTRLVSRRPALPCRDSPCLDSIRLALPYLISLYHTSIRLALPQFLLPRLALPRLNSPLFALPRLALSRQ
ncbi:hypothetical protein E2C01_059619 [Portunus trituberculatus]|uniref:Uncharacterized protein n=1 Tax=Portunus trituberculatus TaxID=210409 RepID=A0A5B7H9J6_PORTR|nr:hypothetical protein [Portunus trituberculatus]